MKLAKKRLKELLPGAIAKLNEFRVVVALADSGTTATVPAFQATHDAATGTVTVTVVGLDLQGDRLPATARQKPH